jgi:hypothetical protein
MADLNSIYCPRCRCHTNLIYRAGYERSIAGGKYLYHAVEECNNCHQHFLTIRLKNQYGQILKSYPEGLPKTVNSLISDSVKKDFEEALLCQSVGAYRGAAVLARRAVQLICLDKGAKEGEKLYKQIEELFDNNIITQDIKDWADEVRYIGNDAAHPNKEEVNKEDSEDILELLESLCDVLYVAPARAAKRKQKRKGVAE